jgi:hypothetical protein
MNCEPRASAGERQPRQSMRDGAQAAAGTGPGALGRVRPAASGSNWRRTTASRQSGRCAIKRAGSEWQASELALTVQRTMAARMVPAITNAAITIRPEGVVRECTRMCQQAIARLGKYPKVTTTTASSVMRRWSSGQPRWGQAYLVGWVVLARLAQPDMTGASNALA